jgi:hypothetical protein
VQVLLINKLKPGGINLPRAYNIVGAYVHAHLFDLGRELTKGIDILSISSNKGTYSRDNLADQIALYAVYMPVLRLEITSSVRTWNNHPIRLLRNRPQLVFGKTFMSFNHPKMAY